MILLCKLLNVLRSGSTSTGAANGDTRRGKASGRDSGVLRKHASRREPTAGRHSSSHRSSAYRRGRTCGAKPPMGPAGASQWRRTPVARDVLMALSPPFTSAVPRYEAPVAPDSAHQFARAGRLRTECAPPGLLVGCVRRNVCWNSALRARLHACGG